MNKRIDRKIQKLLTKASDLDTDLDNFLKEFVIPKFITKDELKFKTPHPIGRYFVSTGIYDSYVIGEVLRDRPVYVPFRKLAIGEKMHIIKALQEEGVFDEQ